MLTTPRLVNRMTGQVADCKLAGWILADRETGWRLTGKEARVDLSSSFNQAAASLAQA